MFAYAKPEHKQKQTSKSTVQKNEQKNEQKSEQKKTVTSPNLTGIPETMKSRFENMSGFSFDDVRVHYNSVKPAQLQALAYTQGNQVHVAPGQERHLGHELGHVVQQKQGRVQPTMQLQGVNVNDDAGLEKEADMMGRYTASLSNGKETEKTDVISNNEIVQRNPDEETSESADEVSDANVHVDEFITKLESLSETIDPFKEGELFKNINNCIAELREIRKGDDETAKTELIEILKEYMSGMDISQTIPSEDDEVVQPMFGWVFSLIKANPKTTLAIISTISLALKIYNEKKKRKLPNKLRLMPFSDVQEYWYMLAHHIDEFCLQQGCTIPQQAQIRKEAGDTLNAHLKIYRAQGEDMFLDSLKGAIAGLGISADLSRADYLQTHLIDTFTAQTTIVANKKMDVPQLNPSDKAGFSDALKNLDFVKKLYSNEVYEKMDKKYTKFAHSDWQDGGYLQDDIKQIDDGNMATRDDSDYKNGNFKEKVRKTDKFFKQALSPTLIRKIKKPGVRVHLRNQQTIARPWGFRAYYSSSERDVHVAQDTQQDTIAHEVGHHIEHYMPIGDYADIQKLLESRNKDNPKAGYIYTHSWEEQRFNGKYPATGKYTSKQYANASSEVMSMSMEYLSNPAKMKTLIEKDPQQAAIILRIINPSDYQKINDLRPFDMYLP